MAVVRIPWCTIEDHTRIHIEYNSPTLTSVALVITHKGGRGQGRMDILRASNSTKRTDFTSDGDSEKRVELASSELELVKDRDGNVQFSNDFILSYEWPVKGR